MATVAWTTDQVLAKVLPAADSMEWTIGSGEVVVVGIPVPSALLGRWVEAEETDALLAPYGEWAGLASVYLLAGFKGGHVPLPHAAAA